MKCESLETNPVIRGVRGERTIDVTLLIWADGVGMKRQANRKIKMKIAKTLSTQRGYFETKTTS